MSIADTAPDSAFPAFVCFSNANPAIAEHDTAVHKTYMSLGEIKDGVRSRGWGWKGLIDVKVELKVGT